MSAIRQALIRLTLLILVAGAAATTARAQMPSDADRQAIRSIISGQIDAFQRDDGATAYGFASPAIHDLFPGVDAFMGMVKGAYQPVYRPRSVTFGPLIDSAAGPLQRVLVVGPDGRNWIAEYTLQRQPDGSWKINGCRLLEDTGETI
jgi:hypothetical protein